MKGIEEELIKGEQFMQEKEVRMKTFVLKNESTGGQKIE